MERPFKAPFYPYLPALALILNVIALVAMVYYNKVIFVVFAGMLGLGLCFYMASGKIRKEGSGDAMLTERG
jgi:ethanolamine permease